MNCYLFGSTYTTLDDLQPFASLAAPTEQTITAMNPNTDKTLRWKTHMPRRDLDEANMSLDEKNMNLDEKKNESRRTPNHHNILDEKMQNLDEKKRNLDEKKALLDGP